MNEEHSPYERLLESLGHETGEAGKRLEKAFDLLTKDLDTSIASTPYEVVGQEDRVKLKHYTPDADSNLNTPLLIVYALINRETMLDLQPDRSVVKTLMAEGVDLFMMDWGYPAKKDKFLTIDDHVNGYMDWAVDRVRERRGVDRINLMGVCMGGTFSLIYAAQHPGKIKNLITTVTPSNFETDQGLLHLWMKRMDVDRTVEAFGNMPGDLMNLGFLMLNPARLMIDKYIGFMENMDDKEFVENFVRMEKWIFDSPDVPGETFRQFIKDLYQQNLLINNRMEVGGKPVDLKRITMPLLNIYAIYDHLVPPEACNKLTSAVGSRDVQDLRLKTGHIGIYVSSKSQREFAPAISQWLRQRD
jgi:polyhydroxyalkanoate synthase